MKKKSLKYILAGAAVLFIIFLAVGGYNYSGYMSAKIDCLQNEGTITEENIDFFAFNWTVNCER